MRWVLLIVLAVGTGLAFAADEPRPHAAPSDDYAALEQAVSGAEQELATVTAKVLKSADDAKYTAAVKAEKMANRRVFRASERNAGKAERANAAAALKKATERRETAQRAVLSNSKEWRGADRNVERAKKALDESDHPIAVGIRENRLAVGMTISQAQKAMGSKGKLTHEDADGVVVYDWGIYSPAFVGAGKGGRNVPVPARLSYTITGTFTHGKLTAHDRW